MEPLFATYVFLRPGYLSQLARFKEKRILQPDALHAEAKRVLQQGVKIVLVVKEDKRYDHLVVGTGWGQLKPDGIHYQPQTFCEISIPEVLRRQIALKYNNKVAARITSLLYKRPYEGKVSVLKQNKQSKILLETIDRFTTSLDDNVSSQLTPLAQQSTSQLTSQSTSQSTPVPQAILQPPQPIPQSIPQSMLQLPIAQMHNASTQTEPECNALQQLSECSERLQKAAILKDMLTDYNNLNKQYNDAVVQATKNMHDACTVVNAANRDLKEKREQLNGLDKLYRSYAKNLVEQYVTRLG